MHFEFKLPSLRTPAGSARLRISALGFGLLLLGSLFAAPGARAADRVYWSNFGPTPSIAYANLNGDGGGGTVNTEGATLKGPHGAAIDSARGLIYWANWEGDAGDTISYAHLDGSGGGDLDIEGATISGPHGLASDPSVGPAGRLYWPNHAGNSISYADLDGSGGGVGGDLTITDATIDAPRGLMIDPIGGRIYWSNYSGGDGRTISYANVDGSGDGDLLESAAPGPEVGPEGTAIDPLTRKIYWSDWGDKHLIEHADLDGTGISPFNTAGATTKGVHGVAIDPDARRLYWANYNGDAISWADLGGSGGQDLDTSGTTISSPVTPSLLKAPAGTGVPQISGDSEPGSILACSPGTWAGDVLESVLYRAPQNIAYQWTLDGDDIPGAEASSITATAEGDYRCRVAATNAAGSTNQTSAAHAVGDPPDVDPPQTVITAGPSGTTALNNPIFAFSSEAGTTFQCRLDGPGSAIGAFAPCTSPRAYPSLGDGSYTFSVRATDQALNTDPTPASRSFKVDTMGPGVTVTERPKNKIRTKKRKALVRASFSSEAGTTFECKLDRAAYAPCASPYRVKAVSKGGKGKRHTVAIEAIDAAGNVGDPVLVEFSVIRRR